MEPQKFPFYRQLKSFADAFNGIWLFIRQERHARIHLFATGMVLLLCLLLHVTKTELLILIIVIGFVWVSEMINSAIEKLVDFVTLDHYPPLKFVKDVAAGAVLVAAIVALITGLIIFIPKIV